MLSLTTDAASAIRQMTTKPDVPQDAGLRIASIANENGERAYALEIAEAPQPEDQVVDAEGARVFLDPTAAAEFDDKALDADVEGGQVRFQVAEQP